MDRKQYFMLVISIMVISVCIIFQNCNSVNGQFFEYSGSNLSKLQPNSNHTSKLNDSKTTELALLNHELKKGSDGKVVIEGQVKNIGNNTAKSIFVIFTSYTDVDMIGTDSAKLTALKPGKNSSFSITTPKDNLIGMTLYEITLTWKNSDGSEGNAGTIVYKDKNQFSIVYRSLEIFTL